MKKKIFLALAISIFTLATTIPAYAGTWKQDTIGWWYQNDDSSYPKSCWQWIDGNNDGIAESYYFDGNGYILTNTMTPDNYQVDGNGAWIIDNVVQTKDVGVVTDRTGTTTGRIGGSSSSSGNGGGSNQATTNENGYVVKRYSTASSRKVDSGTIFGYFDYTGWENFDFKSTYEYRENRAFEPEGEFFCPDTIRFPACCLVEVEFEGENLVKVTPIWIDNGDFDYGGFSNEKEVVGRLEWREFEDSDPAYAEQLKQQLTEEAKQRAFEIYPEMIVDYSK